MQLHHFFHEIQAEPGAFSAAVRARQGVEALTQAWQGVVGNRGGVVVEREADPLTLRLGRQTQPAIDGSEVQCVIDQVRERLTQQKSLAQQLQTGINMDVDA